MSNTELKFDIPGVNSKDGLNLCDGDINIYLHSLRLFVSNMPLTLEKMRRISQDTLNEYAISAHGAKGISEYIGAQETKEKAKQLEAMAKSGDLAGVLAHNEAFIKCAKDLVDGIQNWLEKNNALSA
jgi:HPt (histidine-containing phosphotransfer) domain-containing protein